MKRKTKVQKEEEEMTALRQRVADVFSGACGRNMDSDEEFIGMEEASRIMPALKALFRKEDDKRTYLWEPSNLGHFDNIDSATEFLFKANIRA